MRNALRIINLKRIITKVSSRNSRKAYFTSLLKGLIMKRMTIKNTSYKQFIVLPTVSVSDVTYFPRDVSVPKGEDGNKKEDHPSSRPSTNNTGHNKYLKIRSAVAINC